VNARRDHDRRGVLLAEDGDIEGELALGIPIDAIRMDGGTDGLRGCLEASSRFGEGR
jgi:hypothetical protein